MKVWSATFSEMAGVMVNTCFGKCYWPLEDRQNARNVIFLEKLDILCTGKVSKPKTRNNLVHMDVVRVKGDQSGFALFLATPTNFSRTTSYINYETHVGLSGLSFSTLCPGNWAFWGYISCL